MRELSAQAQLVSALLIILGGALIGIVGQKDLPLDGHEVLVVETARQMQARGDWVLPWFNGEPRLNKPPLNYWATAAIATLTGDIGKITGGHARAVSAIAALLVLVLLMHMGRTLADAKTGLIAAGLFTSSLGFFSFSHDARPDMLYAALCTLALSQFIASESRDGSSRHVLTMWFAFALATLAKGPQLPVMLLLAFAVHLRREVGGWPQVRARLKPLSGSLLLIIVVLPWFILLYQRTGAFSLGHSQLSGSLLVPSIKNAADPYYFLNTLQLILPWLAIPVIGITCAIKHKNIAPNHRLLLLCWLVPAVCLTFGSQKRWFYLLPALPALCLWMACTLRGLSAQALYRFWLAHCGVLVVVALYVLSRAPDVALPWAGLLAIGACFIFLVLRGRDRQAISWPLQLFAIIAICIFSAGVAQSLLPWSADRYNKYELAGVIQTLRKDSEPVYALKVNPAVFVHYAGTDIPRIHNSNQLQVISPDSALVLCPSKSLGSLNKNFHVAQLAGIPHGDHGRTTLVRLTPR